MLPRVNSFFGFQLRTGTLVIGLAQMIYSVIGVLGAILIIADRRDFPNDKSDLVLDHLAVTIIYLIVFIILFVIGYMLHQSVMRNRFHVMKAWLFVQFSGILLLLASTIFYIICFLIYAIKRENVGAITAMIFSDTAHLGNSFISSSFICINDCSFQCYPSIF